MAKKPMMVENVTDQRTGRTVSVMYDFTKKDFFAAIPHVDEVRDATSNGCVTKARAMLAKARVFEWRPVIILIHSSGPRGSLIQRGGGRTSQTEGAKVSIVFRRCEIAEKQVRKGVKGKAFVERPHLLDLPEHERVSGDHQVGLSTEPNAAMRRELGLDINDFYGHGDFGEPPAIIIPYSDEAWTAVHRVRETLLRAGEALKELVGDPVLLIAAATTPILTMGPPRSTREPGSNAAR